MCRSWVPGDSRKPPPQLVPTRRPPSRISTGTSRDIVTQTGAGRRRLTGGFGGAVGGGLASTAGPGGPGEPPAAGTVVPRGGRSQSTAGSRRLRNRSDVAQVAAGVSSDSLATRMPIQPTSKAPANEQRGHETACGEARRPPPALVLGAPVFWGRLRFRFAAGAATRRGVHAAVRLARARPQWPVVLSVSARMSASGVRMNAGAGREAAWRFAGAAETT